MTAEILHRSWDPWQRPYAVRRVLCSDGKRRYARLTAEPDTFFSIPGSVKVGGKTVSGFVWADEDDMKFTASADSKNGTLLPSWEQAIWERDAEKARQEAEEERSRRCAFIGCEDSPEGQDAGGCYFCAVHLAMQED